MTDPAEDVDFVPLDALGAEEHVVCDLARNAEDAYPVLLRAEGVEKNEVDIFSWVRQGDSIAEIIAKGGYF